MAEQKSVDDIIRELRATKILEPESPPAPAAPPHEPEQQPEQKTEQKPQERSSSDTGEYTRYKRSRVQKINSFVLSKYDFTKTSENSVEILKLEEEEQEPVTQEIPSQKNTVNLEPDEWEYADVSQKEAVCAELTQRLFAKKASALLLIALLVLSCVDFLFDFQDHIVYIVGTDVSPLFYIGFHLLLLLLACGVCYRIFVDFFRSLVNSEKSKEVIPVLTVLTAFGADILLLFKQELLFEPYPLVFTSAVIAVLLLHTIGRALFYQRALQNFQLIDSFSNPHSVGMITNDFLERNLTQGLNIDERDVLKNVKTDFLSEFIESTFTQDDSDDLMGKSWFYLLIAALLTGVVVFIKSQQIFQAVATVIGFLLFTAPAVSALFVELPFRRISERLKPYSAAILGNVAISRFSGARVIALNATELFSRPQTVILHGIKTFPGKRIDEAILDVTSVLCKVNSILCATFLEIIANKTQLLKPVDSVVYEDGMGISAWVDEKRVLIGNRELMHNHNIVLPPKEYEKPYQEKNREVIYLSTSGELCAIFVVSLVANEDVVKTLNLIQRTELNLVIKSVDSVLTKEKMSALFGIPLSMFKILPARLHSEFDTEYQPAPAASGLLCNNGSLASFTRSLRALRLLKKRIHVGRLLTIVSMFVTSAVYIALALTGHQGAIGNFWAFVAVVAASVAAAIAL